MSYDLTKNLNSRDSLIEKNSADSLTFDRAEELNQQENRYVLKRQTIGPYRPTASPGLGTVTLGGVGGGDGALSIRNGTGVEIVGINSTGVHVKDTSGTELVTLNASGLTVNRGSVVIYDTGGTTVIDSVGLVSTTQFGNFSSLNLPDHPDITSAAYADIGSATMSVVVSRAANVMCYMSSFGAESQAGFTGSVQMILGTQTFSPPMLFRNQTIQNFLLNVGTVASGTTTYKLQGASGSGTVSLQFGGGYLNMGYLVLGK